MYSILSFCFLFLPCFIGVESIGIREDISFGRRLSRQNEPFIFSNEDEFLHELKKNRIDFVHESFSTFFRGQKFFFFTQGEINVDNFNISVKNSDANVTVRSIEGKNNVGYLHSTNKNGNPSSIKFDNFKGNQAFAFSANWIIDDQFENITDDNVFQLHMSNNSNNRDEEDIDKRSKKIQCEDQMPEEWEKVVYIKVETEFNHSFCELQTNDFFWGVVDLEGFQSVEIIHPVSEKLINYALYDIIVSLENLESNFDHRVNLLFIALCTFCISNASIILCLVARKMMIGVQHQEMRKNDRVQFASHVNDNEREKVEENKIQVDDSASTRIFVGSIQRKDTTVSHVAPVTIERKNNLSWPAKRKERTSKKIDDLRFDEDKAKYVSENLGKSQESNKASPVMKSSTKESEFNSNNLETRSQEQFLDLGAFDQHVMPNWSQVIAIDEEFMKLLRLVIPYIFSDVIESMTEIITIAIIGNFIGTSELSAYIMVDLLLGMTDGIISEVVNACYLLVPQSNGAENHFLSGQYIQICTVIYVSLSVLAAVIWWYFIVGCISLFGFSEDVSLVSESYARICLVIMGVGGLSGILYDLLDVTEHQYFTASMAFIHSCVEIGLTVSMVVYVNEPALDYVAYIDLATNIFFFLLVILVSYTKGWLSKFEKGMICSNAFRNTEAVRTIIKTAIPLSLRTLLSYAEWELSVLFASYNGPTETASWMVIGQLWDFFDSSTTGIIGATEVRVGFYLGRGDPQMARMTACKGIFWGTCVDVLFSAILWTIGGDRLSSIFSNDQQLKEMLMPVFPYLGAGNICMSFGMQCYNVIYVQGRVRLATIFYFISIIFVTVPLGAILTYVFHLNLEGIAFAIVVGYSILSTIMCVLFLNSDWEKISTNIQDLVSPTEGREKSYYDWNILSSDVKDAAIALGYTNDIWDNDGDISLRKNSWSIITDDQREAAVIVGFTQETWDEKSNLQT